MSWQKQTDDQSKLATKIRGKIFNFSGSGQIDQASLMRAVLYWKLSSPNIGFTQCFDPFVLYNCIPFPMEQRVNKPEIIETSFVDLFELLLHVTRRFSGHKKKKSKTISTKC